MESSLANNKQKGIFVNNPQELTPFTLMGNYTLADSVFAGTKKLSVPAFNLYMETLFNDVKSKMDRHDAQKIFVNAIKLLEKSGMGAKEKWNELAKKANDPLARSISLPDVRIEWTEKKAGILAAGQLDGANTLGARKLKKLLEDENRNLGIVTTGPSFFHHSAPVAPVSPAPVAKELEKAITPPPKRPAKAIDQEPPRPATPPPLPPRRLSKAKIEEAPPVPERPVTPPPVPPRKRTKSNEPPPLPTQSPKAVSTPPPLPSSKPGKAVEAKLMPPPLPISKPTKIEKAAAAKPKAPSLPTTSPPLLFQSPKQATKPPPLPVKPPPGRGRKPSTG
jgi:hypothetical protein